MSVTYSNITFNPALPAGPCIPSGYVGTVSYVVCCTSGVATCTDIVINSGPAEWCDCPTLTPSGDCLLFSRTLKVDEEAPGGEEITYTFGTFCTSGTCCGLSLTGPFAIPVCP